VGPQRDSEGPTERMGEQELKLKKENAPAVIGVKRLKQLIRKLLAHATMLCHDFHKVFAVDLSILGLLFEGSRDDLELVLTH